MTVQLFDSNFSWISLKGDQGKGFGLDINSKTADEQLQKDLSRWSNISRNTAIRIYKHFFADFGKIFSNIIIVISLPQFLNMKRLNFESGIKDVRDILSPTTI